jgi:NTE family protein
MLRQVAGQMHTIMAQSYSGDVTIAPRYKMKHYVNMLRNPSTQFARQMMLDGERATWPKISMIRSQAKIAKTLERCIDRTRLQMKAGPSGLRLVTSLENA